MSGNILTPEQRGALLAVMRGAQGRGTEGAARERPRGAWRRKRRRPGLPDPPSRSRHGARLAARVRRDGPGIDGSGGVSGAGGQADPGPGGVSQGHAPGDPTARHERGPCHHPAEVRRRIHPRRRHKADAPAGIRLRQAETASASIHVSVQARIRAFPSVCGPPDPGSAHRFPPAGAARADGSGPPGAGRQPTAGTDLSSHMRRSRRRTFAVTTSLRMTATTATLGALPFPGAGRTAPSSPGRTCRPPSPPCEARPRAASARRRCGARP